jgi:hypothetical protein
MFLISWVINERNWLLVVLITSDMLSGKFGFSTNQQVQSATDGAFSTDVMKRTSAYFKFILYSTAVLALVRYIRCVTWLMFQIYWLYGLSF